jgi:hypothetical protein
MRKAALRSLSLLTDEIINERAPIAATADRSLRARCLNVPNMTETTCAELQLPQSSASGA